MMTLAVVFDGPQRQFRDRFLEPTYAVSSVLLLLVSAVSVLTIGPLGVVFATQSFTSSSGAELLSHVPSSVRANAWLVFPLIAVAAGGAWVGQVLLAKPRKLVLFLRKFGHTGATDAVSKATRFVGRRWLIVTLDDDLVRPKETRAVAGRGAVRFGELLVMLVEGIVPLLARFFRAVLIISLVAIVIFSGHSVFANRSTGDSGIEHVRFILVTSAALLVAGFVSVCCGIYLYITVYALADDIQRGEAGRRHLIRDVEGALRARKAILSNRLSVFGARLVVVKIDISRDVSLWKQTVGGFAAVADPIPLIDISHPSEFIAWEITEMLARFGDRCVFIGDASRLSALQEAGGRPFQLTELLAGRPALAYGPGRSGFRRFARALRATLEERSRSTEPTEQDDPLTDPTERKSTRAQALVSRADLRLRHQLEVPGAIDMAKEATRLYGELVQGDPSAFEQKQADAESLLRALEASPGARRRPRRARQRRRAATRDPLDPE